ncbi:MULTISPECIES: thiopeptide-type bacteriocin biosynthesis protein [Sutcliffiella]|uniref:Thiopeptide-type bacteriocin biosynthesis domain-containing protein n=1 Tax=Sutcliffiella cohnii TaxID=33932 RepID=A0A223KVW6_9BACI|nr:MULTISPECIES: thiopeptide-type bacteriocin biosynthesis protein [Sutcliffiella]AST93513.1 hypothetical protein BC6307_20690 [Sutcliffiella cohnii]WBL14697.1 thiopeptide-type bacteriocin biosynthesis protein [Sutcliffiella sp. NC1]
MEKWISLHIFHHNMRNYDELIVILNQVMTDLENENEVNKWFYIRYWEGGPHVRLRFLTVNEKKTIQTISEKIQAFWKDAEPIESLTKEQYYRDHKFDGQALPFEKLPWYGDRRIQPIPYVPEIERYGGKDVIQNSEAMFHSSSKLVCFILEKLGLDPAKRFIVGLTLTRLLMEQLLEFDDMEDNIQFTSFYKEYWESFVAGNETDELVLLFKANEKSIRKFYSMLKDNPFVTDQLLRMKNELHVVRDTVQDELYIHRIVASHIHMTNNRLGVSPFVEYYISDYLCTFFEEIHKNGVVTIEEASRV